MNYDLNSLRAICEAKIATLEKQGNSAALFRAEIVERILADDNCFTELTVDEIAKVLVNLGFKPDAARAQAVLLKK